MTSPFFNLDRLSVMAQEVFLKLTSLWTLFSSGTFWTAVGAIGTVLTLYFIYRQVAHARDLHAYQLLRREDDRFSTEEMQRDRSRLAQMLLSTPDDYEAIDKRADIILSYFEDLGLMLRRGLVSSFFAWTMSAYYVLRYWEALSKYIDWARRRQADATYYLEFERLYRSMLHLETKLTGRKQVIITHEELRSFLQDELHVEIRVFTLSDLPAIMAIEVASFTVDAYDEKEFRRLHGEHRGEFFVAQIFEGVVGYVAGSSRGSVGEIESIAVEPGFRRLGIATMLTERILERFRRTGAKKCILEVRTADVSTITLYERLGFQVARKVEAYYADGADAFLMEKDLEEAKRDAVGR